MKKFSIADLARITKAHPINRVSRIEYRESNFTGVSIDSRTTKVGDCFFAIPGESFDGHDYVSDALAKGAVCAVVSRDIEGKKFTGNYLLKVEDTIKALGDLARVSRRQAGFKVIAITGSVGKTTTRHIAYHVLSRHFRVFQSPKNFNNNIGLPLTLLGADPEDQIVIAELGSNHPGEIAYLTRIALPDIAVVTNVHQAHLEGFGDLQTIIKEKLSIAEGLAGDGILIINADFNQLTDTCRTKGIRFVTFGKSGPVRQKRPAGSCRVLPDYRASNITSDGLSSRFTIDGTEVYLPLPGPGNVENALAAWAVCNQLGLTIYDFAQALSAPLLSCETKKGGELSPVSMRAELLQIGTLTVLNDCYNANPASMKNALDMLANLGSTPLDNSIKYRDGPKMKEYLMGSTQKRRLVFICGDMAELGRQAEMLHAELGESIAKAGVQLLLTIGKFAKITAQAAKRTADSIRHDLQIECFEDTLSACNNLKNFIKDYDIILVKGSRAAKLEVVVEKLKTQNAL
ncbi:MAG: UDP-N-acetylmuramoyl-tripeptide--D-alanyl-D-alanine ligase [Planctomycetota bacterium]|nr:UDP-N-acetylmuramoyl-tripeptide--D-alanyl-D-alanine ligase [Planctomycetota bacterium]